MRVQRIKKQNPMTTEEATYVIAHNEGIILDRYLEKEAVANIRRIMQQIASQSPISSTPRAKPQGKSVSEKDHRIIEIAREFKFKDPILQDSKINEAKEICDYLRISQTTLYRYYVNKKFPVIKIKGRLFAKKSAIDIWIEKFEGIRKQKRRKDEFNIENNGSKVRRDIYHFEKNPIIMGAILGIKTVVNMTAKIL